MADEGTSRHELAHGLLRAGRAARRRGDDDSGSVPVKSVVLYTADGCSLCSSALEILREVQITMEFELEIVSIDGDPDLETRYREHLPVVEIDGERAFAHFVEPASLRARLTA
ncbi:MAG: glutaredoxin family protein [Actinomycetota bacterium]|nr:glutaredoxin family protein [Actinomycetota bacterium]